MIKPAYLLSQDCPYNVRWAILEAKYQMSAFMRYFEHIINRVLEGTIKING